MTVIVITGEAIAQKTKSLCSFTTGIGSKFMPKYPVKNVSGRKKQETSVSWRTLSFWLAAMVLNISDVRFSAARIDICVEAERVRT